MSRKTNTNKTNKVLQKIYSLGIKKILFIVILLIAIPMIVNFIGESMIKKADAPEVEVKGLSEVTGSLSTNGGEVLVAENNGREMYIDTTTLNIRVTDKATGKSFYTMPVEENLPNYAKSPIIIKFLGDDNSLTEWDAFKYSIENDSFTINKIENGVQIVFNLFEADSFRINEYIPAKITAARYEEAFVNKIVELESAGTITEDQAKEYNRLLKLLYAYDKSTDSYFNKLGAAPPANVILKFVELTKLIEYTTEDLINDSAEFGLTVEIQEVPNFTVTVEHKLEDGDLVVNIPTYEQVSGNDFYTLQNISLYPAFDAVTSNEAEGYIFVPDGSGMLIALNSYNGRYPEYNREVYNNNHYDTMYFKSEFDEELTLPVFGMYYSDEKNSDIGVLGIIESGAELATVGVKLKSDATTSDGTIYNAVYSTVDTMQFSRVKVFGPYASDEARYTTKTGVIPVDYTVRYKLFTEDANYYSFAKTYQDYLVKENNLTLSYDNRPKLFFEYIGAITVLDRFLGIPYDKIVSLTNYDEAIKMTEEFAGINKVINYKYTLNGGKSTRLANKADLVRQNGDKDTLEQLLSTYSKAGDEIFLEADLLKINSNNIEKDFFNKRKHSLIGYDGKPVIESDNWFPDGTFHDTTKYSAYTLLNPLLLDYVTDAFLKDLDYDNITLETIGERYLANYNNREIVTPIEASEIVHNNLEKFNDKTVALNNPNGDKIAYADYSIDVSRESSNYAVSYCSIPFRQLVMSGISEFTTLNVNMAAEGKEYFMLQALETGAMPKFTLAHDNVDEIMALRETSYYSVNFDLLKEDIKAFYNEYTEAFAQVGTKEIANHEVVESNVFVTTYANDVKVLTNYNNYEVKVGAYTLPAQSYKIFEAGKRLNLGEGGK